MTANFLAVAVIADPRPFRNAIRLKNGVNGWSFWFPSR